ncbi:B12-binding domain-containing radical SAM protein [Alkalihalobacillus sp. 1P02AB]|uniref:B12-binding domain-containing radical SAM protein n=1 Tax=Alkalihalobacillus sp. 1P02AB TaxID=3132260 RepID=UPI0039A5D36D
MNIILSTLNAKYIHTSLSIRYLKAYSEPDYKVQLAEYTINDPVINIASDLIQKKPKIIGFSCYIWNIEETIKVVEILKKVDPSIVIVLGGPEVTYDTKHWMERLHNVDIIIIGEGEQTFKQLLDELHQDKQFNRIGGIAYRTIDNEIKINPQVNKVNLKDLPSPFRFEEDKESLSKRVVYIETSRGCPFSCQFCLSSIEVGVRYFDREKIKDDIRYLMQNGAKTIKFVDRTFNISRSYAMEMFQFLIDEHLPGTVFQFEITADIMRPEVIQFLNDNAPKGLFRFEIGVQSTNDHTNELVKRKQNFDKLTRTVTMVRDGGKIDQHLDLIAGLPDEDYDSFKKTFNDVFALRPEELQLGFLKMLRGTGLRINAKQYGYVYMDHSPYEIVKNNVLSFDDMIQIKQVEDVLEKYWNNHRMDETIHFLVKNTFHTPFDFFQEFGAFWDKQGWSRIGHQLEDLFKRLEQFLEYKEVKDLEVIKSLLKYDYLRNHKQKPRKTWWSNKTEKQEKRKLIDEIIATPEKFGPKFVELNLSENELYKHTVIEQVPFHLQSYLTSFDDVDLTPALLVVYYNIHNGQTEVFHQTLDNKKALS